MFYHVNLISGVMHPVGDTPVPAPVNATGTVLVEVADTVSLTPERLEGIVALLREKYQNSVPSSDTRALGEEILAFADRYTEANGGMVGFEQNTGVQESLIARLRKQQTVQVEILEAARAKIEQHRELG